MSRKVPKNSITRKCTLSLSLGLHSYLIPLIFRRPNRISLSESHKSPFCLFLPPVVVHGGYIVEYVLHNISVIFTAAGRLMRKSYGIKRKICVMHFFVFLADASGAASLPPLPTKFIRSRVSLSFASHRHSCSSSSSKGIQCTFIVTPTYFRGCLVDDADKYYSIPTPYY